MPYIINHYRFSINFQCFICIDLFQFHFRNFVMQSNQMYTNAKFAVNIIVNMMQLICKAFMKCWLYIRNKCSHKSFHRQKKSQPIRCLRSINTVYVEQSNQQIAFWIDDVTRKTQYDIFYATNLFSASYIPCRQWVQILIFKRYKYLDIIDNMSRPSTKLDKKNPTN